MFLSSDVLLQMPPGLKGQTRAEIAGRLLLKDYNEIAHQLELEYSICERSVFRIALEYKDNIDQAKADAKQFYENNPSLLLPAASHGNSAQPAVHSRALTHSTHPSIAGFQ